MRVLAVDDDRAYLRRLKLVLTRAGFDVLTAESGPEALERLAGDGAISILVVDFTMPGMDGIETVRQARSRAVSPQLYTIMLSGSDSENVRLRALENGLDDFLHKSFPDAVVLAKLRNAARRVIMERRLEEENEQLHALALTDELTGLANRRALFREAAAIAQSEKSLTVILFDLDHFKEINDTFGHLMGDRILMDVALCLKSHTRLGDVIARWGGDEFVVLLPGTSAEHGRRIASRILRCISLIGIEGSAIRMTAQHGIARTDAPDAQLDDLLAECDRALYSRKRRKRGSQPAAML